MIALLSLFLTLLVSPFKSRSRLEAENAALGFEVAHDKSDRGMDRTPDHRSIPLGRGAALLDP
jgi:hypothetical protein